MKAAQINEYGGHEVLKTVDNAARPQLAPGQILIEVHAAGVNPFDWSVREGHMQEMAKLDFPATLGGDFAGIVAELGDDVKDFNIGDAVYGQANALSSEGSYAEFTAAKAGSVALKPESIDFVAAAAVPLAGVSAYQALVDHADLQKSQKILIHGGAGGIGSFAIQLAKQLGAYVATTVSAEDIDYVKDLGADETINYKAQKFEEMLQDYDAVFDTVGGETNTRSYPVLKTNGTIISMVAQPNEELMKQHGVNAIAQFTQVTTERLTKLSEVIDSGAIQVTVNKVFPLGQASEALAYIKSGKHRGKVVLKVR